MNTGLLQKLIEAGTPAELIAEVASELARADVAQEALETRRAKDRERAAWRQGELPDNWNEVRTAVFARDDFTCQYCWEREPLAGLHCDHVIPLSKGGSSELSNLRTACGPCNSSKRDKLLSEWGGRQ